LRIDRHEHIGKGHYRALEGCPYRRCLLNDPRFRNHPMTLETDKGPDLVDPDPPDVKNLQRVAAGTHRLRWVSPRPTGDALWQPALFFASMPI
jgi:hypothetical protein